MSDDAGTGAPEGGQPTGDSGAPKGKAGTATATAPTPTGSDSGGFDAASWRALADEVGLTPEQLKKELGFARTWEKRAKENKGAADQLGTLQTQLDKLQQQLADKDVAEVERNGKFAIKEVRTQLAEAGVKPDQVTDLLAEIEPTRLLKDGQPNDEAIARVVSALRKVAGRPAPDPDQGKGAGKSGGPASMNDLIRRAAGFTD